MPSSSLTTALKEVPHVKYFISVERLRTIAYAFFWLMCIFAIAMSKLFVVPYLKDGPDKEGDVCGPFNREVSNVGAELGKGFDLATQSHLIDLFGYNNICSNWDYSPSRELTAMVYPLFEYSLLFYLIMNFVTVKLAYQKGLIKNWFWQLSKVFLALNLFFCAQFRMIFVCIAYENVQQHTAGFLGLQIALILIATENTLYVIDADISYAFLGGMKRTRQVAITYLVLLLITSAVKVSATTFFIVNGYGAAWSRRDTAINGVVFGQIVDWVWMLFNAVLPLGISIIRERNEDPITVLFLTTDQGHIVSSDDEEGKEQDEVDDSI